MKMKLTTRPAMSSQHNPLPIDYYPTHEKVCMLMGYSGSDRNIIIPRISPSLEPHNPTLSLHCQGVV